MPVIPPGIEPYSIRAPLTTNDQGEPSESVQKDTLRVLDFIEDERHLTAQDLLQSVRERIDEWEVQQQAKKEQEEEANNATTRNHNKLKNSIKFNGLPVGPGAAARKQRQREAEEAEQAEARVNDEYQHVKNLLEQNKEKFDTLDNRCRLFRKAQKNLEEEEEWTLASTMFGIETYYRREPDGSLSLKLEGEIQDVPLFEQICVLKEVDLHYKWAPFCSSSFTVADLDKLDTVGWFFIGLSGFGLARDGVFRAIGCDNFQEDGSILLAGQGIKDIKEGAPKPLDTYLCDDPVIEKLDIPPVPSRRGASRMTINTFDAVIHVTSPTSAVTKLVANINPNISFLPQSLLEFIMKNLAGVLLAKLQTAAKQVVKHPVTNEHARKMREEEEFYRWVMAKFQAICDIRGWDMPPVGAFELTQEDLLKESKRMSGRKDMAKRSRTYSGTMMMKASENTEFGSGETTPKDDDLVSELTSQSGRSWRGPGSPLRTFIRHRREGRANRKEAEIREAQIVAAERNIPKPLSSDKEQRLQQLREARARQATTEEASMASSSVSAEGKPSWSERITDRLKAHSGVKRFFVMAALLSLLFASLNPEVFKAFFVLEEVVLESDTDKRLWFSPLLGGLELVAYLFLCAILHFAACDIMLVYAFDSFDLGKKAGRQVKKYYSDNVRVVVAAMSLGIMALSLIKALSTAILRLSVSWCAAVYEQTLDKDEIPPDATASDAPNSTSDFSTSFSYLNGWSSAGEAAIIALRSLSSWLGPLISSIDLGKEEPMDSWKVESFETARTLFSNTVSPLLVFLLLFSYSARLTRKRTNRRKSDESKGTDTSEVTPNAAETSNHSFDIPAPPTPPSPTMNDYSPEASGASSKRRKRRLRFRRMNHRSEPLGDLQEVPLEHVEAESPARAYTM